MGKDPDRGAGLGELEPGLDCSFDVLEQHEVSLKKHTSCRLGIDVQNRIQPSYLLVSIKQCVDAAENLSNRSPCDTPKLLARTHNIDSGGK